MRGPRVLDNPGARSVAKRSSQALLACVRACVSRGSIVKPAGPDKETAATVSEFDAASSLDSVGVSSLLSSAVFIFSFLFHVLFVFTIRVLFFVGLLRMPAFVCFVEANDVLSWMTCEG